MGYAFLDFGKVLCYPTTGNWFITPFLERYLRDKGINPDELTSNIRYYGELLDRKLITMDEEEEMFYELYKALFERHNYNISNSDLQVIADDITYSTNKYQLYNGVRDELEELKHKYDLILLSDNWPCGEYLMHNWDLDKYFKELYISSYYGIKKDNQDFFRIPMDEFGIDPEEIVFVDDSIVPLETATSMGIKSYQMDREHILTKTKYPIIHSLKNI